MSIEVKVPSAGESISEVFIGPWRKSKGDTVRKDEPLVDLETDKATMELPAPATGTLSEVLKQEGDTAQVGEVIAYLEEGAEAAEPAGDRDAEAAGDPGAEPTADAQAEPEKEAAEPDAQAAEPADEGDGESGHVTPAARRALREHGLRAEEVQATGPGGRLLPEDVLRHVEGKGAEPAEQPDEHQVVDGGTAVTGDTAGRREEVVPMSPIRRRIAQRLVEAQQTAALLTTFNEIDMSAVIALREEHKEAFQERYGVKLGFMSFFVKASIDALRMVPQVNAEIRDTDIVYRDYYDIGVAVGGGKGLVVPVLRNAERMSFAEVESAIADFARRAQDNKLQVDELQGGTFTISNGGVYGSLLSTPIINPPQSGILGLHKIEDRPVVRDGQVVVGKMMYVALTYDHRIVDGREAVTFLKRVKEAVEAPARMLLEI